VLYERKYQQIRISSDISGISWISIISLILHEKNDFAEISKNLVRYRSNNNFVWIIIIEDVQADC